MITNLRISQIYVLDQDEALAFYVDKLGLKVNTDQDLGFMRWLTVSAPDDPDREILLERPGAPSLDDATANAVVDQLGAEGFGNFANALLVAEQRQRLRLIWDRLEVTP